MAKAAITRAVLGLGTHLGNIALLIFKKALCCGDDPEQYQQAV
jgi:hypothetical protein